MKVSTKYFGEVNIKKEDIINIPKGIPAFEEVKDFVLIPAVQDEKTPFYFLQSIKETDLCFLVLDTFTFFPQYDFEVDDTTVSEINLNAENISVFTIVNAHDGLKNATTNLKAPIIINTIDRKAKQVVLEKGNFSIKQPLIISELNKTEKVEG